MDLMIARLDKRLVEQNLSIELTDAAKELLADRGFDPVLGARPLRRAVQRDIEDALSEKILFGEIATGSHILVDAQGEGLLGEFTFTSIPAPPAYPRLRPKMANRLHRLTLPRWSLKTSDLEAV